MNKQVVYEFQRNQNERVCATIGSYKDRVYIDLRVFFNDPESGELRPTKKGLTIENTLLPHLKNALIACEKAQLSETQPKPKHTHSRQFS